jgi:hypothetical protein
MNSFFAQSFLSINNDPVPRLEPSLFSIPNVYVNSLLCPEAHIKRELFNTFFNSSEFTLKEFKYYPNTSSFVSYDNRNNFSFKGLSKTLTPSISKNVELTLIEPGVELIRNSNYDFCSKAGDAIIPYKHVDPVLGNYEDLENKSTT